MSFFVTQMAAKFLPLMNLSNSAPVLAGDIQGSGVQGKRSDAKDQDALRSLENRQPAPKSTVKGGYQEVAAEVPQDYSEGYLFAVHNNLKHGSHVEKVQAGLAILGESYAETMSGLKTRGAEYGDHGIDGIKGNCTKAAIEMFRQDYNNGLFNDGQHLAVPLRDAQDVEKMIIVLARRELRNLPKPSAESQETAYQMDEVSCRIKAKMNPNVLCASPLLN